MGIEEYTEADRELRGRLGPQDFLVDLFRIGEEMQAFIETPVGAMLVAEFRDDVLDALGELLDMDDPTTPEARALFMRARVGWNMLKKIDGVLSAGAEAEKMIVDNDQRGDAQ